MEWWMQSLGIQGIWSTYNEYGANAKIAVLDSGYNSSNTQIVAAGTYNAIDGSDDATDNNGHGSYCASIIGARNTTNVIGCAPQSQLFIGKITDGGSILYSRISDAITWAISMQVDVISISYGGPTANTGLEQSINDAVINHNIVVVSSIGDNIPPNGQAGGYYPALCSNSIAVGATGQSDNLLGVTMLNAKTEINAPGESISGYTLTNTPAPMPDGTSQATAIVAGVCALIISRHKQINKSYTVQSVKDLLTQNFDPITNNPAQRLIAPSKIFPLI
jgi:subtilisin family serine protease